MKLLLKQAKIIDSTSKFNNKKKDILIENGHIVRIEENLDVKEGYEVVESKNLHVSKGWIDLKSHFCDPGHEYKETVETGLEKAAQGGFSQVVVLPSTAPVMDHKASIDSVLKKAETSPVTVIPMGCLTKEMKGRELAELYDMQSAGAKIFTDDTTNTTVSVLNNALMYAKNFQGKIAVSIGNAALSKNTQVNEGEASLRTGLKGDPEVSEIMEIEAYLRVLEYSKGVLHISGVSTKEGAQLIAQAKKKGLNVTADVHIMNVCFDESEVVNFDTRFKTQPPLRSLSNMNAMWEALESGAIDCVVSNHRPTDSDEKEVDFENATFEGPQLQTVFPALNTFGALPQSKLIEILCERPASVLNIEIQSIALDTEANLTIFDPDEKFDSDSLQYNDKSYTAFDLSALTGRVIGIVHAGKYKKTT